MPILSYEITAFELVCDKCGEHSEWVDDKMVAIDNACFDGWTVKYTDTGRVLSCLCSACSDNIKEGE